MSLPAASPDDIAVAPISPHREIGAYEALWLEPGASFKSIAERFAKDPSARPSDLMPSTVNADAYAKEVRTILTNAGVQKFGVRINHTGDYPLSLRDAKYPVELLYYRGIWELMETPSVAVVGARKPTTDGTARARRLAKELVRNDYTVVSGLASGIDTAAHSAALDAGGRTVAVVGTALGSVYPRENNDLQELIATEHLLVSQVPIIRYSRQDWRGNRAFFPERNITMSALTQATIIVEAGETSGTLIQARAALYQGRKLFILNSCFGQGLKWPERLEQQGALRVHRPDDIWSNLD